MYDEPGWTGLLGLRGPRTRSAIVQTTASALTQRCCLNADADVDDVLTGRRVRLLNDPQILGFAVEAVLGAPVGEVNCARSARFSGELWHALGQIECHALMLSEGRSGSMCFQLV